MAENEVQESAAQGGTEAAAETANTAAESGPEAADAAAAENAEAANVSAEEPAEEEGGSGGPGALANAFHAICRAALVPGPIVRIAVGMLILGGMTAGLFFLVTDVIGPRLAAQPVPAQTRAPQVAQPERPRLPGVQYKIDEIVLNPAGSHGKRFLRLGVALETVGDEKVVAELTARQAQVRDLFIRNFSTRTLEELTDPVVREELRAACIAEINDFLIAGKVDTLFFTDYVLQ